MTKYEFIWRVFRFLFVVAVIGYMVWSAVHGNGFAIGVLFTVVALILILSGAAGALYAGRVHNGLILEFLKANAAENKAYFDAVKSRPAVGAGGNGTDDGGLIIEDGSIEIVE